MDGRWRGSEQPRQPVKEGGEQEHQRSRAQFSIEQMQLLFPENRKRELDGGKPRRRPFDSLQRPPQAGRLLVLIQDDQLSMYQVTVTHCIHKPPATQCKRLLISLAPALFPNINSSIMRKARSYTESMSFCLCGVDFKSDQSQIFDPQHVQVLFCILRDCRALQTSLNMD